MSSFVLRRVRPAVLCGVLLSLCVPALAQTRARGATLSGRVVDARARAVPDALVALLRQDPDRPNRLVPVPGAMATTSKLGRYTLSNVAVGDYYLVAIPTNAQLTAADSPNRSGFGITYFPNAKTPASARLIKIRSRAPVVANMTVAPAVLSVITGRVLDGSGKPAAGAILHIAHGGPLHGLREMQATAGPDGRFSLAGFAPGIYTILVPEFPWPAPPDVRPRVSAATVVVAGADQSVRVDPVRLVRVRGHVTAEGEFVRGALTQSPVFVNAEPMDPDDALGPNGQGIIRDDLSFDFLVWPGRLVFSATPDVWHVKSVRRKGKDVTAGLDVPGGDTADDLVIELTPD